MINDSIYTFILIGIGGTIVLDIYAWLLATFFGLPATNWLLVGRWVGHMKSGQFIQPALPKAERIPGELIIGWVVHYLIGITYGLILMLCVNPRLGATPYPTSQFTCCMGAPRTFLYVLLLIYKGQREKLAFILFRQQHRYQTIRLVPPGNNTTINVPYCTSYPTALILKQKHNTIGNVIRSTNAPNRMESIKPL